MIEAPETRYAQTDEGLRIAYQVVGEGSRDIALVSAPCCIDMAWEDPVFVAVAARLCRLGRLILFDWRGFGSSDPVSLGALPTPENWLDDLRVVLDAASSDRVHLIGTIGGSTLATLFAATYPQRTASIVLIDGFARTLRSEDYRIGPPQEVVDSYIEWMGQVWGSRELGAFEVPSRADEEEYLRWSARARRLTQSPQTLTSTQRWTSQLDLRSALPSVHVPTLILQSSTNPVVRFEAGKYLAEHIPDARLEPRDGRENFMLSRTESGEVLDHIEEFITGERPVPDADRVFATILFTDLVASTTRLANLGDERWKELLDRHDELVDRELVKFRGRKIASTGDGVLATFDGPARAVRCARALLDAVTSLGLESRAGLHAGEVEVRGKDIGGIAVHIGQRVSALARPGEVLVSRTVTDLVAGSDLQFEDRGEYELKGIPGSWKLFAVKD